MLIVYREVCGNDHFLEGDLTAFCHGSAFCQFLYKCILINVQSLRDLAYEFQWVKLCLVCESYRAGCLKGQFVSICYLNLESELRQGVGFFFQFPSVVFRVYISCFSFEITVCLFTEPGISVYCFLVSVQVHPCFLGSETLKKSVIDQSMLSCDLCSSIPGDPIADAALLHKHVFDMFLLQEICT